MSAVVCVFWRTLIFTMKLQHDLILWSCGCLTDYAGWFSWFSVLKDQFTQITKKRKCYLAIESVYISRGLPPPLYALILWDKSCCLPVQSNEMNMHHNTKWHFLQIILLNLYLQAVCVLTQSSAKPVFVSCTAARFPELKSLPVFWIFPQVYSVFHLLQ